MLQVIAADIPGHVFPRETRRIEGVDVCVLVIDGQFQVLQILVNQPVGTDDLLDLFDRTAVGDQLICRGHVDAVDVGMANRRCGRGKIHALCAGFPGHHNNLLGSGTAHDRVIHQQHVLASELKVDCVELAAHGCTPLGSTGHDEGPPDIAVLHEALPVLDSQFVGHLNGRGARRIGYRDHHVDTVIRTQPENLGRQFLAHAQTRLVDRQIVDDRVGPGKIDELEYTRRIGFVAGVLAAVDTAGLVDKDAFAGRYVAVHIEPQRIQGDALGRDHALHAGERPARAQRQWADAVGVAKCHDPVVDDHGHDRVGARTTPVHRLHGTQNGVGRQLVQAQSTQFMGEYVQQDFGIRVCIQMSAVMGDDQPCQLVGVDQIAVVSQGNSVGRIDIERLRLCHARRTRGWISNMPEPDLAPQTHHVVLLENIADQTVVLAQMQLTVRLGHDARGVLSPMLQVGQGVVDRLVDRTLADDSYNSAHGR